MSKIAGKIILLFAITIVGCSTLMSGKYQNIQIATECNGSPVAMSCNLSNEHGTWSVNTPGGTVIQKGFGSLTINCSNGYVASVDSSVKALAFGNVVFGGWPGAIVDINTGAGFDYPEKVKMTIPACTGQSPQVNRWWR